MVPGETREGEPFVFRKMNSKRIFMNCEDPKTRFLIGTILVLVLAQTGIVRSQTNEELIQKAIKVSGLHAQIRMLDQALLQAVPLDAFPDMKIRNKTSTYLNKAAREKIILARVAESVMDDFRAEMLQEVLNFYDSRLGSKIGRLQSTALSPDILRSIREGRKTLVSLDDGRRGSLRRIIKAESVSEDNSELLRSFMRGLARGYSSERDASGETVDTFAEVMETFLRLSKQRTEPTSELAYAFTFQSLSDKELNALADYHESEPAIWFGKAVKRGLNTAVYETAEALGNAMRNSGECEDSTKVKE